MAIRWASTVAGLTLAVGLIGQAATGPPSISVVAYNHAGIDARTLTRAKDDVVRIYGEAGVLLTWRDPGDMDPAGSFAIQIVIRRRPVNGSASAMGRAIGDAHDTGGLAFVYVDRVLRSAHEREQDVARLLAYAMAHEMGHLVLPYPAHSPSGIMRPEWDGDDLRHIASGALQFAAVQANAIRVKVSACCTAPGPSTGLPSPKP